MRACDIVIIGCGPAGLGAAIQLRRMGEAPLVFEARKVGGQLWNAHLVENYPGFPDGIGGPELAGRMREHLKRHDPEIQFEEVVKLDVDELFELETAERRVRCRTVIMATGTRARRPGGFNVSGDVSGRVFSEIFPIREVTGKHVVIVGSGDAAFDYALNLAGANRVTILNRSDRTRCLPLLKKRADHETSIDYRVRSMPLGIETRGDRGLRLACSTPGGDTAIDADFVLLAIGREPRLDFLTGRLRARLENLRRQGAIHLIGDVGRGMMRQTAIAVGDGVRAAIDAHAKLEELSA
jgi:thioredoxin reductase (NADPH)